MNLIIKYLSMSTKREDVVDHFRDFEDDIKDVTLFPTENKAIKIGLIEFTSRRSGHEAMRSLSGSVLNRKQIQLCVQEDLESEELNTIRGSADGKRIGNRIQCNGCRKQYENAVCFADHCNVCPYIKNRRVAISREEEILMKRNLEYSQDCGQKPDRVERQAGAAARKQPVSQHQVLDNQDWGEDSDRTIAIEEKIRQMVTFAGDDVGGCDENDNKRPRDLNQNTDLGRNKNKVLERSASSITYQRAALKELELKSDLNKNRCESMPLSSISEKEPNHRDMSNSNDCLKERKLGSVLLKENAVRAQYPEYLEQQQIVLKHKFDEDHLQDPAYQQVQSIGPSSAGEAAMMQSSPQLHPDQFGKFPGEVPPMHNVDLSAKTLAAQQLQHHFDVEAAAQITAVRQTSADCTPVHGSGNSSGGMPRMSSAAVNLEVQKTHEMKLALKNQLAWLGEEMKRIQLALDEDPALDEGFQQEKRVDVDAAVSASKQDLREYNTDAKGEAESNRKDSDWKDKLYDDIRCAFPSIHQVGSQEQPHGSLSSCAQDESACSQNQSLSAKDPPTCFEDQRLPYGNVQLERKDPRSDEIVGHSVKQASQIHQPNTGLQFQGLQMHQTMPGYPPHLITYLPSQLSPGVPHQLVTDVHRLQFHGLPRHQAPGMPGHLSPGVPSFLAPGVSHYVMPGADRHLLPGMADHLLQAPQHMIPGARFFPPSAANLMQAHKDPPHSQAVIMQGSVMQSSVSAQPSTSTAGASAENALTSNHPLGDNVTRNNVGAVHVPISNNNTVVSMSRACSEPTRRSEEVHTDVEEVDMTDSTVRQQIKILQEIEERRRQERASEQLALQLGSQRETTSSARETPVQFDEDFPELFQPGQQKPLKQSVNIGQEQKPSPMYEAGQMSGPAGLHVSSQGDNWQTKESKKSMLAKKMRENIARKAAARSSELQVNLRQQVMAKELEAQQRTQENLAYEQEINEKEKKKLERNRKISVISAEELENDATKYEDIEERPKRNLDNINDLLMTTHDKKVRREIKQSVKNLTRYEEKLEYLRNRREQAEACQAQLQELNSEVKERISREDQHREWIREGDIVFLKEGRDQKMNSEEDILESGRRATLHNQFKDPRKKYNKRQ